MKKLKIKLIEIADTHKREFSRRTTNQNRLEALQDKISLIAVFVEKISDELISEANKYFKENNVTNTDEMKEFIKYQVIDFIEFANKQ